jgi:hypothetical protein
MTLISQYILRRWWYKMSNLLVMTHFTDYSSPLKCNSRLVIKKSSLFMAPICSQVPAAGLYPVLVKFGLNLCILFWSSVLIWAVFCCQLTSMIQATSSFHFLLQKCHVLIVSPINSTCHASFRHTNYIRWKGIVMTHHCPAVFVKLLPLPCVELLFSVHIA